MDMNPTLIRPKKSIWNLSEEHRVRANNNAALLKIGVLLLSIQSPVQPKSPMFRARDYGWIPVRFP